MKYRLIRFDAEGKVVLDEGCVTPNQFGDNYEWRNSGCSAVLVEYSPIVTKNHGQMVTPKFYDMYPNTSELPEALWRLGTLEEISEKYKYVAMLKLTGAL